MYAIRRIIPARAGFTSTVPTPGGPSRDHPRSRGVYPRAAPSASTTTGSSPLARGLRRRSRRPRRIRGIIPARAGFTDRDGGPAGGGRDHPRSRGVYGVVWFCVDADQGSSPLARGLPMAEQSESTAPGIIPARAGFTGDGAGDEDYDGDHPRSRGVYSPSHRAQAALRGSSPLARGLRRLLRPPRMRSWIIPARAGFTRAPSTWACTTGGSSPLARGLPHVRHPYHRDRQDHPRSRGVYAWPAVSQVTRSGSSPLARGLQEWLDVVGVQERIIPARAGFTARRCTPPVHDGDHPRSRGVYLLAAAFEMGRQGSSPLARGLRRTRCGRRRARRDHPRSRGVYEGVDIFEW